MSSYVPPLPMWIPEFNSLNYSYGNQSVTLKYVNDTFLPLAGGTMTGNIFALGISLSSTLLTSSSITMSNSGAMLTATQFTVLGNASYTGASSTILFTGNSSLINMTGNASKITLAGNTSSIELTGTGGHIDLTNSQASSNISTGTIRSAGGAYFGNDTVISTQLTIGSSILNSTNAGYLTSISPGTASASKALVLDVNRDIVNIRNLTTTVSLISPQLTISGTNYNPILVTNTLSTGDANVKFVNDLGKAFEIGIKGSASSPNSNFYIYDNINTTQRLQIDQSGNITINGTQSTINGTIISSNTTDATSSTGAILMSGGISIAKSAYITNKLNIGLTDTTCKLNLYATGNHMQLVNTTTSGSTGTPTTYSNIAVDASGNLNITNYASSTPSSTQLSASGWLGLNNIGTPRYTVDLGTNDASIKVCLKQLNNSAGTPTYGIGTLSGNVTISTGGGYQLWLSSNPGTLSTLIQSTSSALHQVYSTAIMFPNNGWIGTPGYQNQISLSSAGGLLVGTNTQSYTSNWLEVAASASGHSALFKGGVVIGTTTSSSIPLYVGGSGTQSYTGSYGWLAQSGTGTAANFTSRSFSAFFEQGIMVNAGEIDVTSDIRLKKDIENISEELALTFIDNITPIAFKYKPTERCHCEREHLGFSAQEIASLGFHQIVGFSDHDQEDIEIEEQKVNCINGKILTVPANKKLTVSAIDIIPLLTKALQMTRETLNAQEKQIAQNKSEIAKIKAKLFLGI